MWTKAVEAFKPHDHGNIANYVAWPLLTGPLSFSCVARKAKRVDVHNGWMRESKLHSKGFDYYFSLSLSGSGWEEGVGELINW